MHTDAHMQYIASLMIPESCQSKPADSTTLKLDPHVTVSFEGESTCGGKKLVIRHNGMATQRIVIGKQANVSVVDVLTGDLHEDTVHSIRMGA